MKIIKQIIYEPWSAGKHICHVGLGDDGELYFSMYKNPDKYWKSFYEMNILVSLKEMIYFSKEFGHLLLWL